MLRIARFLHSQLTDGGAVVSLTCWPPFTPWKIHGTHFCQRLRQPQGHSATVRIRSIEKSSDFIRNRSRNLPGGSTVLQPTMPLHALHRGDRIQYLLMKSEEKLCLHFGHLKGTARTKITERGIRVKI
jgi:hypothetical protein